MSIRDPYKITDRDSIIQLEIDIEAEGKKCKISMGKQRGGNPPAKQYYVHYIDREKIDSLSKEIYHVLNSSSESSVSNGYNYNMQLKQAGCELYLALFPKQIREKLQTVREQNMLLIIHESLVGIPWELMHDGEECFCLRFNLGRTVYTSHTGYESSKTASPEQSMLIIADPMQNLSKAIKEGEDLINTLEREIESLDITLEARDLTIARVTRELFNFNILHYAGHAVYNRENPSLSGWRLKDGILTAQEIKRLFGGKISLPSLIFANACQSGQTSEWPEIQSDESGNVHSFDLVNAFILSGARHYIGTFGRISDPFSFSLSKYFYDSLIKSYSIGESLRMARKESIKRLGRNNLIWAHYVLYGDPTTCYFNKSKTGGRHPGRDHIKGNKGKLEGKDLLKRHLEDNKTATRAETFSEGTSTLGRPQKEPAGQEKTKKRRAFLISSLTLSLKKWGIRITAGCIGILVLFLLLTGVLLIYQRITEHQGWYPINDIISHPAHFDLERDEKKWETIKDIQEQLNRAFPVNEKKQKDPPAFTICILPSIPAGGDLKIDRRAILKLISSLTTLFSARPGYIVVERDRLDFVLQELQRSALKLTEGEFELALGRIFSAQGILFVLALKPPGYFSAAFNNYETDVFVRLVETETTIIKANIETTFNVKDIKKASSKIYKELLLSLEKSDT